MFFPIIHHLNVSSKFSDIINCASRADLDLPAKCGLIGVCMLAIPSASVNAYYCIKAVSHVINSRALTGEKPCINKAIHALLMHGYATFSMLVPGPQICCRYAICTACHSQWKLLSRDIGERRNKIVQEITRNVVNVFSFYAIIPIEHGFSMH